MKIFVEVNMDLRELYKTQDYLASRLTELIKDGQKLNGYDIMVSLEALVTDIIQEKEKLEKF